MGANYLLALLEKLNQELNFDLNPMADFNKHARSSKVEALVQSGSSQGLTAPKGYTARLLDAFELTHCGGN